MNIINQIRKNPKKFEKIFNKRLANMTPKQRKNLFKNAYKAGLQGVKDDKKLGILEHKS